MHSPVTGYTCLVLYRAWDCQGDLPDRHIEHPLVLSSIAEEMELQVKLLLCRSGGPEDSFQGGGQI